MINQLIELVPNSIKYLRLVTDGNEAVYLYASHDGLNFGLIEIVFPQPTELWYEPSND